MADYGTNGSTNDRTENRALRGTPVRATNETTSGGSGSGTNDGTSFLAVRGRAA